MHKSFATALIAVIAQADNAHDDAKIAGLVEGFFVGAFDFHGMTDIGHCVSDANPVEQHFENAMRGFWNGSFQEATKAIDQLGLAVSDIGDMLDHCGKIDHHDYEQIQRMAEAYLHPKQILLEATESLIVNGVNVFEDTREGLHDYRMGKWLDAGEHFGQASAMLLYGKTQMVDHEELFYDFDNHWQELLDQIDHEKDEKMHHFEAMKSSNVHFTFFRMGKILEGLLAGSVEAEVPHGVECLRDAKHIWERLGGVEDQLKQGSFNSMLHAIEDLGHIIHDIANELEECKATVGTDLDKLREMSKAFTDPWYFIFHVEHDLIVNGQDVHHEVMDAMAQWENQHFYEYGHSVGLALSKIFLGGQMKNGIPSNALPNQEEDGVLYTTHGVGYYPYGHRYYGYRYPYNGTKDPAQDGVIFTHGVGHYPVGHQYYGHSYPYYAHSLYDNAEDKNEAEDGVVYTTHGVGYYPYGHRYYGYRYPYNGTKDPAQDGVVFSHGAGYYPVGHRYYGHSYPYYSHYDNAEANTESEDGVLYTTHGVGYYPYGHRYYGYRYPYNGTKDPAQDGVIFTHGVGHYPVGHRYYGHSYPYYAHYDNAEANTESEDAIYRTYGHGYYPQGHGYYPHGSRYGYYNAEDANAHHEVATESHHIAPHHHANDDYVYEQGVYTHHAAGVHHDNPHDDHHSYTTYHSEPEHFVEAMTRHDGKQFPHVVYDHPAHHTGPTHYFPHTPDFPHQEEAHVEFSSDAHDGPVGHEVHTVIPHHDEPTEYVHHVPAHEYVRHVPTHDYFYQ